MEAMYSVTFVVCVCWLLNVLVFISLPVLTCQRVSHALRQRCMFYRHVQGESLPAVTDTENMC